MIATGASLTAALAVAGGGNVAVVLASADSGASQIAPWLQGGGSAAAVAGLVYVARMIVKGDLVPRAVAERENETAGAIRVQAVNVVKLQELVGEGLAREKTLAGVSGDMVKALAENAAELRWWRDQRERGHTVDLPSRRGSTVADENST